MNAQSIAILPDTAAGEAKFAALPHNGLPAFGNKRDVGALAGGMSVRWVEGEMNRGMPHLRLGARRVRFDLQEVAVWLKETYGCQRRGKLNTRGAR
jgi:hypothetical protein